MASSLVIVSVALAFVYGLLRLALRITQDSREPEAVECGIPFLSPVIGMLTRKTLFYVWLRNKYQIPICTMRLPGMRIYVVNSSSLIALVQRQSKALTFDSIKVKAAVALTCPSQTAIDVLHSQEFSGENGRGYAASFHKRLHAELSPKGDSFHAMTSSALHRIAQGLDALGAAEGQSFGLWSWVKHEVMMVTTTAVYGPDNPFLSTENEKAYWEFESGIMPLLLKIPFVASKSAKARGRLVDAFRKYYTNTSQVEASGLTQARHEFNASHGVPEADIARFEIGGSLSVISSLVPAAFWMLYHVMRDPNLLARCQREVEDAMHQTTSPTGQASSIINASAMEKTYPTLMAAFKEVLRLRSVGTATRQVTEEHLLDGQYLLKRGNLLMMSSPAQHSDSSIWGDNVAEFDHTRFLHHHSRHPPVAFRGFGGGATLCPGRYFAATIVLSLTAMLIMRFDVTPEEGVWPDVSRARTGGWEVIPKPGEDVKVNVRQRSDRTDEVWSFTATQKNGISHLTVEDLVDNS